MSKLLLYYANLFKLVAAIVLRETVRAHEQTVEVAVDHVPMEPQVPSPR